MRNLHSINRSNLPDIIQSQLWWIFGGRYPGYTSVVLKLSNFTEKQSYMGNSVIYIGHGDQSKEHYYNWKWEPGRLKEWIAAGRPPINWSGVKVIYE